MLAGDNVPAILFEVASLGMARAQRLALLDERRDFALETLDAGIRIRHDSTYDARKQSLAAAVRKKCVKGEKT